MPDPSPSGCPAPSPWPRPPHIHHPPSAVRALITTDAFIRLPLLLLLLRRVARRSPATPLRDNKRPRQSRLGRKRRRFARDALLNYSTSAEKSVFFIFIVFQFQEKTEQEEKEGLNVRLSDLAVMFQALGCRVFFGFFFFGARVPQEARCVK